MATASAARVGALSVLLAVLLGSCQAVDFSVGACKDKEVAQDFDVGKYMGLWYEIARYWQVFELNGKCVTAEYALNATSNQVAVKNSMVDSRSQKAKSIEGFAELSDPQASPANGKLDVTFKIPVVGNQKAPYWVLATDYSSYAVVYSCSNVLFGTVRAESAWILSRTPQMSSSAREAVQAVIAKQGLKAESFLETVQDCGDATPAPAAT